MTGGPRTSDDGLFGAPEVPERIGRFAVIERLPGRRIEQVYRARDPDSEGAIVLRLFYIESDHRAVVREAQRLVELTHEHLVPVVAAGMIDGQLYIASRDVGGELLPAWLAGQHRDWRQIIDVFRGVGRGLAEAHRAGVVHGDVRPEAITVSPAGEGLLGDFALPGSRRVGSSGDWGSSAEHRFLDSSALDAVTMVGGLLATPAYMAPERHRGRPADARSDQFSFCAVLFEALCGVRPFAGDTLREVADAILAGARVERPPQAMVPPAVERVLERGLATAADERFESVDALVDAIAPARRRRGGRGWLAVVLLLAAVAVGVAYGLGLGPSL